MRGELMIMHVDVRMVKTAGHQARSKQLVHTIYTADASHTVTRTGAVLISLEGAHSTAKNTVHYIFQLTTLRP